MRAFRPWTGEERISVLRLLADKEGTGQVSVFFREISGIGCIESFEVTFIIRLLFTGFECEKDIVGMVVADIGNTVPE